MIASQRTNLLLDSLPEAELALLTPLLERMYVKAHEVLVEPNEAITYVYFPLTCMISLVTLLDDGTTIESATVGNEGMSGLSIFHGLDVSNSRAIIQMDGETLRLRTAELRNVLAEVPALSRALRPRQPTAP
jgi:CRP-like cAMP-binding protein